MRKTIALAVLCFSLGALADKTITLLTVGSEVVRMTFTPGNGGGWNGEVCGRAPLSGGGFSAVTCYSAALSGALLTDIQALATGRALTYWKTQEGL